MKTWEERQAEKDLETRTIQENITRCQGNQGGLYKTGELGLCNTLPIDTEILCPYLDRSTEVYIPGGRFYCCTKPEER